MAAAEMTETVYNVSPNLGGKIIKFEYLSVTSGDWIIFDDPIGCVVVNDLTGAVGTQLYSTGAIHTPGITATSTEMVYDGVTAEQMPASGYIMVATGEIIKYSGVTKADTSGTATLDARGCFGTTPHADADAVVFYILNTIIFTATAGAIRGIADVIGE